MSWIKIDNEKELSALIHGGNHDAFSQFYAKTVKQLFSVVNQYTKDPVISQDLVQHIYIKLWEKRNTFSGINSLSNYLFIIARNTCLDFLRKTAREKKAFRMGAGIWGRDSDDITEGLYGRETEQILNKAMDQLSPQQYKVFKLSLQQELSCKEIAEEMSISSFTVKRHLELARKFVRSYVAERIHLLIFISLTGSLL